MKNLPFNCKMGKVSVSPADWKTGKKDSLNEPWFIRYRFYDGKTGKSKFVRLSNFNRVDSLEGRRKELKEFLAFDEDRLEKGYNPINGNFTENEFSRKIGEVNSKMPFEAALKFADSKINISEDTRKQETNNCKSSA